MTLLLPTKFYPPPAPGGFMARPQLLEKMDEALSCRLTLVSAPAGAGKTVLVSAWAQSKRQRGEAAFGWLSLDEADNAPGRFWEYLAACLEEGGAGVDVARIQPENGETGYGESVSAGFMRGLVNLKGELMLILDDYHLIQNKEIHAALGKLLEHTPPRLHLVLLTRSDPPLELARLRVRGQLAEIRMEHLRFSAQETAVFVQTSAGVRLSETDAAALNERAEGWVAGLQMAAISLRGRSDAGAFVAAFAGSHRFVFDFLMEQVLNRQLPDVREFLLKTSVLERFSAPLCAAVTGTESARQFLDTLERNNLFLVPLDDERGWYRYHHLFADLLKLMLEQGYPGLAADLHRRAGAWHEAQGHIPEALAHALAADDLELAARLVAGNVLALVERAELAPILLRMDAAPREQREAQPWLGVAHAWALAYSGQLGRAETALALAETRLDTLAASERDRLAGHIAAVRAYAAWVQGDRPRAVELAESAERRLPMGEIAVRALNLSTLGNALNQYAASQRSVEVLELSTLLARQAGLSHVYLLAATALVYAFNMLGQLRKAHTLCLEALEVAEAHQQRTGEPLPAVASVYAELAVILTERGEIERAIQAARKGLVLSEQWGQIDTTQLCLLALANGLSLAGEFESARTVLQRARLNAQKVSPWFVQVVDEVDFRVLLDAGEIAQAGKTWENFPASLLADRLLQQNHPAEALALLERAEPAEAQSLEIMRRGIIRALALFTKNDESGALAVLKPILAWAEPDQRIAIFVREGLLMEKLLRRALTKSLCPEFTRQLLTVFVDRRQPQPLPAAEALIEPLSDRELEILSLLDGPLSTPEIAAKLFVSSNTVRTHIKNIYGKLGVHGRSGAVRRAQELGLLM